MTQPQANDDGGACIGRRGFVKIGFGASAAAAGIVDGGFDLMGAPNDGEVVFMDFSRRCLSPSDTGSRSDLGAFESGAVDCESVDPGAAAPMLPAPIFLP